MQSVFRVVYHIRFCLKTLNRWWYYTQFNFSNVKHTSFSALTLLVGRQEGHPACKKTEWWGTGVVICLEWSTDLHTAQLMCHCHSLSLAPVKSRLVLPFWYRLTPVVLEKKPLNGCSCNGFKTHELFILCVTLCIIVVLVLNLFS